MLKNVHACFSITNNAQVELLRVIRQLGMCDGMIQVAFIKQNPLPNDTASAVFLYRITSVHTASTNFTSRKCVSSFIVTKKELILWRKSPAISAAVVDSAKTKSLLLLLTV